MYIIYESSQDRLSKLDEIPTKAEAFKRMRAAARAAGVWGIRSRIWIEKDGATIASRTTTGSKYPKA